MNTPRQSAGEGRRTYPDLGHVDVPEVAMPTHDQIAALAYQLWIEQGQPADGAEQNWLEAEQRLMVLVEAQTGNPAGDRRMNERS